MVEVTFVGTGAAFSTRRRSNISMLVREDDDVCFLIECGPAILFQLDQVGATIDQITHLFVSHRHGDHILGVPMFLLTCYMGKTSSRPLTILGSKDVIHACQKLTHIVYPELDEQLNGISWVALPPDQTSSVELGSSLKISTLPMPHSKIVSVLGVRLDFPNSGRSLVYTGDTSYHEDLFDFAAGCDLLVHESNFSEVLNPDLSADDYGHSTARQAGLTAASANCGTLALVHLSPKYAGDEDRVRAEAAEVFGGQIVVPDDGTTIQL